MVRLAVGDAPGLVVRSTTRCSLPWGSRRPGICLRLPTARRLHTVGVPLPPRWAFCTNVGEKIVHPAMLWG